MTYWKLEFQIIIMIMIMIMIMMITTTSIVFYKLEKSVCVISL